MLSPLISSLDSRPPYSTVLSASPLGWSLEPHTFCGYRIFPHKLASFFLPPAPSPVSPNGSTSPPSQQPGDHPGKPNVSCRVCLNPGCAPGRSLRLPEAQTPHVSMWIKRQYRPGARSLPWHIVSAQQILPRLLPSTIPPFPESLCSISHPQPAILPAGLL